MHFKGAFACPVEPGNVTGKHGDWELDLVLLSSACHFSASLTDTSTARPQIPQTNSDPLPRPFTHPPTLTSVLMRLQYHLPSATQATQSEKVLNKY